VVRSTLKTLPSHLEDRTRLGGMVGEAAAESTLLVYPGQFQFVSSLPLQKF
jgi:hypothetical protein